MRVPWPAVRRSVRAFTLTLTLLPLVASAQNQGTVELTLEEWLALEAQIRALESDAQAPPSAGFRKRSVDARFDRGVLEGRLTLDVDARSAGEVVPLIHGDASLASITVDGAKAVAIRSGPSYAVVADAAGPHRIEVAFAIGEQRAGFARAFAVMLPPAPVSTLRIDLPERDLDVAIDGGVVLAQKESGGRTVIEGAFDARAALSVTWRPKVAHTSRARELEVTAVALVGLEDDVVRTRTRLDYKLISGETDRLEVGLPDKVEVTGVTGTAVLQWYTDGGRLVVLLKHLVADEVSISVDAQSPITDPTKASLAFIRPADASVREAILAVEGRAGFAIRVASMEAGEAIGVRDDEIRDLSNKPLLFAYRGRGRWPDVALEVARNAEIPMTQAVIDDLQASTVVTREGVEVTKLRLYVRNNTRQYLSMALPPGAEMTHALIDGIPFHPAVAGGGEILVPLRQSERLVDGRRRHVVRSGETLGGISLMYLGTPGRWSAILEANPDVGGPEGLAAGQVLEIPAARVEFEESNFVVEIAYERRADPLALFGSHDTILPALDIAVMSATWHLYFPDSLEPLSIDTNLQQLTSIRYDFLRRARRFFERALEIEGAWASGWDGSRDYEDGYENILMNRKKIYREEQESQATEVLSSFPLVGRRYRFERVLLGDEQARLSVVYLASSAVPPVRWAALLLALAGAYAVARALRARRSASPIMVASAVALAMTILVGHYVLGVHRSVLYGVDLGLAIAIIPALVRSADLGSLGAIPFERVVRGRSILRIGVAAIVLAVALMYPLLLSTFVLAALLYLLPRTREVTHA
jgi:hypothetical protein